MRANYKYLFHFDLVSVGAAVWISRRFKMRQPFNIFY